MKLHLAGLFAIALAASTAKPALAGYSGFQNTGSMNIARAFHTATLLANGQVLVTGGVNSGGVLASTELYNPATGNWTLTGSMTVARDIHDAVLLQDGRVLVAGGQGQSPGPLSSAEPYDPSTGTWTATGSMHTARDSFLMILLPSGEVLAAGSGGNDFSAELYNPATGTWTPTGNPQGQIVGDAGVVLPNGEVYASAVNLCDPATGTWSTTSSPPVGGSSPIALLQNGDVWTAGDVNGESLYDPSTNQWTTTVLSNGQVLVAGGETFDRNSQQLVSIASAELYTP